MERKTFRTRLASVLTALALIFGFGLVAAPSANAVNTYYHAHDWCMYSNAYYVGYGKPLRNTPVTDWYVHVDYSWAEEVFQFKRDYHYYSHRTIWSTGICG